MRELQEECKRLGATLVPFREIQNGRQFHAERGSESVLVNIYSGARGTKIHIPPDQGPLGQELQDWVDARNTPESKWATWIGTDESGKGDYFGPLVVAGVLMTRSLARDAVSWGIRDSKEMTTARIHEAARRIREATPAVELAVDPPDYNRRYEQEGNLNSILGWGHAEVIRGLIERGPVEAAVADKFGRESYIRNALGKVSIELIQRVRAESDPAVAAASVVARSVFLRRLEELSGGCGLGLPRGAGPDVIEAAREFVQRHGRHKLQNVAKLHFKTTHRI